MPLVGEHMSFQFFHRPVSRTRPRVRVRLATAGGQVVNRCVLMCMAMGFLLVSQLTWAEKKEDQPERRKVLVMDLENKGVPPDELEIINGLVAYQFSLDQTFDILSGADLRQLMVLEAERQTVGCTADNSCLAEIAGAMGAQWVVFGHVGKLGNLILLNLNLFDSHEAKAVARSSLQVKNMDEMPASLEKAVTQLLKDAKQVDKKPEEPAKTAAAKEATSDTSVEGTEERIPAPAAVEEPAAASEKAANMAEAEPAESNLIAYVGWGIAGVGAVALASGVLGAAGTYVLAVSLVTMETENPGDTRALWFGAEDNGLGLAAAGVYGGILFAAGGAALAAGGAGTALFVGGEE